MAHTTLTALVNHVHGGQYHRRGDVYEFEGTDSDLRELVDGGYAATEANLGKASVASDVKRHRDEAARLKAELAQCQSKLGEVTKQHDDLDAQNAMLRDQVEAVARTSAELRAILEIGEDDSIVKAVSDLKASVNKKEAAATK